MSKIAIVDINTLEVALWYDGDTPNQSAYGGEYGDKEKTVHLKLDSGDHLKMGAKIVGNNIVLAEDETKKSIILQAERDSKLSKLRSLREEKLAKMEIMARLVVLRDLNLKTEVDTYRTALLEVTDDYKEIDGSGNSDLDTFALDMADFTFPEPHTNLQALV